MAPRYSRRNFDWSEPVAADGSIPLDTVVEWLRNNRDEFRRASNKFNAVTPLYQQLNDEGVKCTVDNILLEVECLTRTAWRNRTVLFDAMYGSDLFERYFNWQGAADLVRHHREYHTHTSDQQDEPIACENPSTVPPRRRVNWQMSAFPGGQSPNEILVNWFPSSYEAYVAAENEEKWAMLRWLCEEMTSAGHDGDED
ncbi:hypothetical protein PHYPSEUDO_014988 [Phytophthora pseudosyringae]|uniref:Uncharacterized protein n=1 Tax=Phytophthora pseudosyringae TaxID=221518 RepID=A0A8T1WKR1_9STRA|nr:hypothetical protein PHYPSEUDO_014988 [Phytophthora pseudosyringae]